MCGLCRSNLPNPPITAHGARPVAEGMTETAGPGFVSLAGVGVLHAGNFRMCLKG